MIIIDACVAVKWFVPEQLSEEAESLLTGAEPRAAPEHILVEVGQTLLRFCRAGEMSLPHAQRSIEALGTLVQLIPTRLLASSALDVAVQASCTNYDALYVAAAEYADADLVTADQRFSTQIQATRWRHRVHLLGRPGRPSPFG